MSGKISVGVVYEKSKSITEHLNKVLTFLENDGGMSKKAKFSVDEDGKTWTRIAGEELNDLNIINSLVKGFNGEVLLDYFAVTGHEAIELTLRIINEDMYFGFIMDFEEAVVIPRYSLHGFERMIVQILRNMYNVSRYDYAFCDHEAEIEYSPSEFCKLKEDVYSLYVLPVKLGESQNLLVNESSWAIDGLTLR